MPDLAALGTDANGDGVADPWNAEDAIYSAARYLAAAGGAHATSRGRLLLQPRAVVRGRGAAARAALRAGRRRRDVHARPAPGVARRGARSGRRQGEPGSVVAEKLARASCSDASWRSSVRSTCTAPVRPARRSSGAPRAGARAAPPRRRVAAARRGVKRAGRAKLARRAEPAQRIVRSRRSGRCSRPPVRGAITSSRSAAGRPSSSSPHLTTTIRPRTSGADGRARSTRSRTRSSAGLALPGPPLRDRAHDDDDDGKSWTYCHLSVLDPGVAAGVVARGAASRSGLVGMTDGERPHLHLQLNPQAMVCRRASLVPRLRERGSSAGHEPRSARLPGGSRPGGDRRRPPATARRLRRRPRQTGGRAESRRPLHPVGG